MALQLPVKDGSADSVQMYFTCNWGRLIQNYSFVPLEPTNQTGKKKREVIHWNTSASCNLIVWNRVLRGKKKSKKHPLNFHPILALIETSAPCEMCHGHDTRSPLSLTGKNKPSATAIKAVGIGPSKPEFISWGEFNWGPWRSSYNCLGAWSIWQGGCV